MKKEEILRLSRAIQAFIISSGMERVRPKELMPHLIAEGFFRKDEKFGKPLRDVLNQLDKSNQLDLLPQVRPERQEKAVYWYFEATEMLEEETVVAPAPKAAKAKTDKPAKKDAVAKPAKKEAVAAPAKKAPIKKATTAVPAKKAAAPKAAKKEVVAASVKKAPAKKATTTVPAKKAAAPKAAKKEVVAVPVKKAPVKKPTTVVATKKAEASTAAAKKAPVKKASTK